MELIHEKTSDEIYFICELEGEAKDLVIFQDMLELKTL